MGRPEREVDSGAGPVERLASQLRELRADAGSPGYRELAERTGYSISTLANAAGGRHLPSLPVVLAFVRACGGDPAEWEQRWRRAARQVAVGRGGDAAGAAEAAGGADPPYRGLLTYQVDDAAWFFGRGRLIAHLARMVERQRFVAVFGVSGSGKSSLLRAGLVPAVTGDGGYLPVLLTPGSRPLTALRRAVGAEPSDRNLLVVVDQFEELFTLCQDPAARTGFVAELAALVGDGTGGRTRVVVAVRADFFARCAELPELAALMAGTTVPVGPPTEDELRDVITGPARQVGLSVERALVTKILADASGQPGALPLVSHALLETWRHRRGTVLSVTDYEGTGGVRGAVAQTAEAVYQGFDEARRETARQVLVRLVALGEGAPDTRRRISRAELDLPGAGEVLAELAAQRLVVLDQDTVELAHEAVVTAWPRLHGWLRADRDELLLHRELTEATATWLSLDRDPGALYQGLRLAAWDHRSPHRLTTPEQAFLAASRDRRSSAQQAGRRRVRLALTGLTAAAAVMSVLAGLASAQADRAADERDLASAGQLAATARAQLDQDPELALILAQRAFDLRRTPQAAAVLRQAVEDSRVRAAFGGPDRPIDAVAYSPDGSRIATHGEDGIRVWPVSGSRVHGTPVLLAGSAATATTTPVFSADGRYLTSITEEGRAVVWDLRGGGRQVRPGPGSYPATPISSQALARAGTRIAVPDQDGAIQVRDVATGREVAAVPGEAPDARSTFLYLVSALSPDGGRLATNGDRVRIWDLGRPGDFLEFRHAGSRVGSLAFSPDGRRLVGVDTGGSVLVWRTDAPGRPAMPWRERVGPGIAPLAFSPDGQRIAAANVDGVVLVGDLAGQRPPVALSGHRGYVSALAFSPDGRWLTTGGTDGGRVWDVARTGEREELAGQVGRVSALAVSPDGRRVASGATDGTVRLWDASAGPVPAVLPGHTKPVRGLAFSRDSRRLASSSDDGTVRIWHTSKPALESRLDGAGRGKAALAFSPDGRRLAGGYPGSIRVWDLARPGRPRIQGNQDSPDAVAFTGSGGSLIVAGLWVRRWDDEGLNEFLAEDQPLPQPLVTVDAAGRRLAASDTDGVLRVWDLSGRRPPAVLRGHRRTISTLPFSPAIAFSSDGRGLALSDGNTLRIWPTTDDDPVVLSGPHTDADLIAFGPDQRFATAVGSRVHRWQCRACGPIEQVRALARSQTTRTLSPDEVDTYLRQGGAEHRPRGQQPSDRPRVWGT